MLTSYDAQQYVMASLRAGARGFVLKTVSPKELTAAIATVSKGGLYLDPEVALFFLLNYLFLINKSD